VQKAVSATPHVRKPAGFRATVRCHQGGVTSPVEAFVQLYAAIKAESHLQWLIERIDKFTDQSLIDLLQQQQQQQEEQQRQRYISDPTGECVFCRR